MLQYMRRIAEARRREDGASAVEYGLLVAAIAALIVLVVFALGGLVKDRFAQTCREIAANPETEVVAPPEECAEDAA